ncbi:MAG: DEAD/DEAH box helicase [Verrucomicrobiota bacterium]
MSVVDGVGVSRFHPLVGKWFEQKYGEPTDIQKKAWGLISEEEHALISAATGSGKTLAAFLWGLNQLISGEWESGRTRVIYISPLKALNNDIRRNLLEPLGELGTFFEKEGVSFPEIRVQTRSGDTSQNDRRKMLRKPPEILITTPESFNLLLTSGEGQRSLLGAECVILDEIHSLVDSKRGAYLMSGIERLAYLNGEFQRIALSATVKPMETVAALVGGYRYTEGPLLGDLEAREVKLAISEARKLYEIEAKFPEESDENQSDDDFWHPIVVQLKELVAKNESTLIFVNSRLMSEKLTHKINKGEVEPIAYSHHGSLSKEIRAAVEGRMKRGELKAIVATNSLEMGIDVGALDCVVMVQCPNAISSAIQKIGRAGHQVGAVSRSILFPSHSRDFLEAAVLAKAIRERDIEPVKPIRRPLDVLAQVIISVLGSGQWDLDELYRLLVASYSFRELQRREFDLVLDMMSGRYAATRLRELKPRIAINRSENTATLRKGALMTFYLSGGVIPDRGYFHLRMEGSGARVGELDEEFVWERSLGDVFTLGTQSWKIKKITHNDVFVNPAESGGVMPPFWRSETYNRDFHYSTRIGEFLEAANEKTSSKGFEKSLSEDFSLDEVAAKQLGAFLSNQKTVTRCDLPHRHHVVAELVNTAPQGAAGQQLVLHTHWGGRVNRPYGLALTAAWQEKYGVPPEN